MHKHKSAVVARRAWNSLRLALLWARRGGHFKNRRLMVDLRLLPKFINRTLGTTSSSNDYYRHRRGALHYGERQLSFDDTPVIHFKMHRPSSLRFKMPNIPCITGAPQVDFDDYDFDRHDCSGAGHDAYCLSEAHNDVALSRKSILLKAAGDYITSDEEEEGDDDDDRSNTMVCDHQETNETPRSCDDGIDLKAEQFIANFYRQIKLQRQISYLQYHDMISRGAS